MEDKFQESNQMLQNSLYTCLLSSNPTKEHLKFVTSHTEGKFVGELSAQDQISSNIQPNCELLEHIFFLRNVKYDIFNVSDHLMATLQSELAS